MGWAASAGRRTGRIFTLAVAFGVLAAIVALVATPAQSADVAGTFAFVDPPGSSSTVGEAAGTHAVAVDVDGMGVGNDLDAAVTVDINIVGGTAVQGTDYSVTTGQLVFPDTAVDLDSQSFVLSITSDAIDEDDETIVIEFTLTTTGGSVVGTPSQHTVTITDDDAPPDITINDPSTGESSSPLNFTVGLTAESGKTVTVGWTTSDGTATAGADYTSASGTVTFVPGDISETVAITVLPDVIDEPNETFDVQLSGATNAGRYVPRPVNG